MRQRLLPASVLPITVLSFAGTAHACGMHFPDWISAYPGLGFFRPDVMLLLPILAGTLERPFYSLAGYTQSTLGYSIQANLLGAFASNLVGIACVATIAQSPVALLGFVGAPLAAMAVKRWWFNHVPRDGDGPSAGFFFLATLLSTIVIALIPFWMNLLGTSRDSYAAMIMPIRGPVIVATLIAVIAVHVSLFVRLKRLSRDDPRHGFEVLMRDAEPIPTAKLA